MACRASVCWSKYTAMGYFLGVKWNMGLLQVLSSNPTNNSPNPLLAQVIVPQFDFSSGTFVKAYKPLKPPHSMAPRFVN